MDSAGFPVFKQARMLFAAGAVVEVGFDGKVMRGVVIDGRQQLRPAMVIKSKTEVDNLCRCRALQPHRRALRPRRGARLRLGPPKRRPARQASKARAAHRRHLPAPALEKAKTSPLPGAARSAEKLPPGKPIALLAEFLRGVKSGRGLPPCALRWG
ncbi:MAG: hypothetical protein R3F11_28365 [Verrucomicrobiales bacterium]